MMKRFTLALLLGMLLFAAQPASAIPFGVHFYGAMDSEMNETLDRFNGGNIDGLGISLSVEPIDDWSLIAFHERIGGSEGDWDPTDGRFVPYDGGNPVYDGAIRTRHKVGWTGLGIRYDFAEAYSRQRENQFQFYVTGALATVGHRLTMHDEELTISDSNRNLGWLGGVGVEWVNNSSTDTDQKLFGLFFEMGRRDYNAQYDIGAGFGPRLSHAYYWRLGVGFFFGK